MKTLRIMVGILSGILLFIGTAWILQVYQGYRKGRMEYQELADHFTSGREHFSDHSDDYNPDRNGYAKTAEGQSDERQILTDETESEGDAERVNPLPEDAPERISIKWADLLAKNSDVVGWILLPGVDLSYPVLQGEDNEKYLHRSIEGEYLYAGSIFLECKCNRSFHGFNTILYGHNMRDGSMFAKLKDYRKQEIYDACPYFWIFTPEKDLLYRICSVHPEGVGGSSFVIRFGSGKELSEWRNAVRERSEIDTGWEPKEDDRIVTLSTCTEDHGRRYTVQGVLVYTTV